jgi:hypothetical protein
LSLYLTKYHAMKTYGGVEVWPHAFLTSALGEGEWLASWPSRFTPRERAPSTHWIGGWVAHRASLDTMLKRRVPTPLPGIEPRSSNHPACSWSLYQLNYPGSVSKYVSFAKFWMVRGKQMKWIFMKQCYMYT